MLAAASAGLVAAIEWRVPSETAFVTAAMLLVMAILAQVWPLHLSTKVKITVDDLPTFAAALLLSPFDAIVISAASTLIGLRFRHTRMRWYNRGFNAAPAALGTGAASLVYGVLHGPVPPVMSGAIAILCAGAAKYLVQAVLIDFVVALQLKRRPLERWWEVHRRDVPYETSLYLLGALAAVSAGDEPLALVLFGVPIVAMLAAMRATARVREPT